MFVYEGNTHCHLRKGNILERSTSKDQDYKDIYKYSSMIWGLQWTTAKSGIDIPVCQEVLKYCNTC